MGLNIIPIINIKTRDILLRLKKSGIYAIRKTKPVSYKEIQIAIDEDNAKIKEIENNLSPVKINTLKEIEAKYDEIKNDKEWLEICSIYDKIYEYNRFIRSYSKEHSYSKEGYEEILKLVSNGYSKKYQDLAKKNKYFEFYNVRCKALADYSEEMHYLRIISELKESISELQAYCLEHGDTIKRYRIR